MAMSSERIEPEVCQERTSVGDGHMKGRHAPPFWRKTPREDPVRETGRSAIFRSGTGGFFFSYVACGRRLESVDRYKQEWRRGLPSRRLSLHLRFPQV